MQVFKVDFTFVNLKILLQTLQSKGFFFYGLSEYVIKENIQEPYIILRHDVEARYKNALQFARIQNELGIKGTYYFRLLHKTNTHAEIIQKIAELGLEIGYHYDDLSFCKGDPQKAIQRFESNLNWLRQIAPVETICMEGAPFSKYDNRDLWSVLRDEWREVRNERKEIRDENVRGEEREKLITYHSSLNSQEGYYKYGIIAEPYFDLDFSKLTYFTDTGRRWDGKYAVRDKVTKGRSDQEKERRSDGETKRQRDREMKGKDKDKTNTKSLSHSVSKSKEYKTTGEIIKAIQNDTFPQKAMMTFHPQRWHDKPLPWLNELIFQNIKNQAKKVLLKYRNSKFQL